MGKLHFYWITLPIIIFHQAVLANNCIPRHYGKSSFVCVCNATYCDSAPIVGDLAAGQATLITSTRADARFRSTIVNASPLYLTHYTADEIFIDASVQYQKIMGFGGAFTDASGINIAKLSVLAQQNLLKSYFSTDGIEYGLGRVPIGGSDFSTRAYTYDDFPGDDSLSNFSLAREDLFFKIPYISWAQSLSSKPIKLFASPWSAPAWMKSNGKLYGKGYLLQEYYQVWADYFIRFFEEYKTHNLTFFAVSPQNEPMDGNIPDFPFNCMGWTAGKNFHSNLRLETKGFASIKIMVMDDQRILLPKWAETVLAHPEAKKYVAGVAVHWYGDLLSPPIALTSFHEKFPNHFILATEACEGDKPWQKAVSLGSWERLESYAHNIIEDLNHWVTGWVDWNLVLDEKGGPNWSGNFVDSPIIINNILDEFYKQPMYYGMGHFSKYIPEDSVRIGVTVIDGSDLFGTAFLRPDGKRTIVILNR
ncbi:hypothetical protein DAPPUDRAFT_328613 [Daphnia pulex]|uniref:Glucosylceramidase n=1 Tax=Daphnia pulex TaxID=6669 RepID=E9HE79_DAPPU|nr:hypothetical protein DAPPUDRAFT_328613 [Daphnia pulex]|eukprot:EFX69969.1 hypothetical protein DAPPUDRAFT_328613 [Daphnia pulex]